MKRESKTLFALFVLAIVLLAWRACAPRVTPRSSVEAEGSGAAAVAGAVVSGYEGSSNTSAAAPTTAATAPTPATAPGSLVPPIRGQRLDDFADSRDLQQFIDRLMPAVDAGDGEAARLVMMAYEECFLAIAIAKSGRSLETTWKNTDEAMAYGRITKQRCAGVVSESMHQPKGWVFERVKQFESKALEGGDISSLAMAAGEIGLGELPPEDRTNLLRRIAASGNDDAMLVLSELVVQCGGGCDELHPSISPFDRIAWRLVSCHFGRDCEPNGRLVREKCLSFNVCLKGSYRDYVRHFEATPYQFELAVKKERQILDSLARGALDEVFPLRPKQD